MTNKEKYKQAFSVLHASDEFPMEVERMKEMQKKHKINAVAAAAAACIILAGGSISAYAADVGGIQEKLSLWIHGSRYEAEIEDNGDGGYTFHVEKDGETKEMGGGGVSIDENGNETPLSAEEIVEDMNKSANVEADENGRVWVYYYDQKIDITDLFNEDGICRIALTHNGEKTYLEVTKEKDGSYPSSQTNDLSPKEKESYTEVKE